MLNVLLGHSLKRLSKSAKLILVLPYSGEEIVLSMVQKTNAPFHSCKKYFQKWNF